MNFMQTWYQSSLYGEYKKNIRLQWMVVAIALILTLSLLKYSSDSMQQQRNQTQAQIELLARLELAAHNGTSEEVASGINSAYSNWIDASPTAPSASVAEAQALTEVEQLFGKIFKRKRLNLVGSEQLVGLAQDFWQVRVEITGQMVEQDLIELLQHFDSQHKYARIASFQYSPKTSNTISLVIDLIYTRAEDA